MITEFRSKAAGGFFMTEPAVRMIFSAIGRDFTPSGIFTEEQVPVVRRKLANAIEQSRSQDRAAMAQYNESILPQESTTQDLEVGLSQRAFPLLEMLIAAEKQKVPVVWGV